MALYKVIRDNIKYLSDSGIMTTALKGSVISVVRYSDSDSLLKNNSIKLYDRKEREREKTGAETKKKKVLFAKGQLVTYMEEDKEFTGVIVSVSKRGILAINLGTESKPNIVKKEPKDIC